RRKHTRQSSGRPPRVTPASVVQRSDSHPPPVLYFVPRRRERPVARNSRLSVGLSLAPSLAWWVRAIYKIYLKHGSRPRPCSPTQRTAAQRKSMALFGTFRGRARMHGLRRRELLGGRNSYGQKFGSPSWTRFELRRFRPVLSNRGVAEEPVRARLK